jgi:hypothetical protein
VIHQRFSQDAAGGVVGAKKEDVDGFVGHDATPLKVLNSWVNG